MAKAPCLSHLLKKGNFPQVADKKYDKSIASLQLKMLRIQQGIWNSKSRAIIVFEGFDAAGKGGAIQHLVEKLDPRGVRVHPIGPPREQEQNKHYLYRFWQRLPNPGTICIFDRSWYGRVLVERVEHLVAKHRWHEAYNEIVNFEETLQADGISIIKIFLAIDKKEQLKRFEERLNNPYKQWKLSADDVRARSQWKHYVNAVDDMLAKTSTKSTPWHLIPANDKNYARIQTFEIVTNQLAHHGRWMKERAQQQQRVRTLKAALRELGHKGDF